MTKAVILCAGRAQRLKPYSDSIPKPLIKVAGREILFRTVELLRRNGIEEFVVVVNEDSKEAIERFLKGLGINFKMVVNPHPERENGYSLLLAKDHVKGKFVLTMGDHLYSESFIEKALKGEGLIVDDKALYTDPLEATKVFCENGRIKDIGKRITNFNCYDTGFFILDESIFEVAERLEKEREKLTVSEIVKEARIKCYLVSGEFWTDVDTPEDLKNATYSLIKAIVQNSKDGLVSRYINRRFSTKISALLVDHLSPNQATLLSFAVNMLAVLVCFFSPALGGILYQVSSILDGVDGEIARAKLETSKVGGWLDSVLDRIGDFAFLFALSFHVPPSVFPWVLLAVFGSLMVSYTTERYRGAFCKSPDPVIEKLRFLPAKRDERIFAIMIFCLLGLIEEIFVLLAVITNARVFATLWVVLKSEEA